MLQSLDQQEVNRRCNLSDSLEASEITEEIPNASRVSTANKDMELPKNETAIRPPKFSWRNSFFEMEGRNEKCSSISNVQHANDAEFRANCTDPNPSSEDESESIFEEKSVCKSNTDVAVKEEEGLENGKELYNLKRTLLFYLTFFGFKVSFSDYVCEVQQGWVHPSVGQFETKLLHQVRAILLLESMTQKSPAREVRVMHQSLSSYLREAYRGHLQKPEGKLGIFVEKYLKLNDERIPNRIRRVRQRRLIQERVRCKM